MISPIVGYQNKKYPDGNVTQWFGENSILYSHMCQDGQCLIGHNGIDIVSPWGTPIRAVEGGTVCDIKDSPNGYGRHVRILTDDAVEWTYGHLSEIYDEVKIGCRIGEGQFFCNMGNTGFVVSGATPYWQYNPYAGTHLHLGKRLNCFNDRGWAYPSGSKVVTLNYRNGYMGSVDFDIPDDIPMRPIALEKSEKIVVLKYTLLSFMNQLLALLINKKSI